MSASSDTDALRRALAEADRLAEACEAIQFLTANRVRFYASDAFWDAARKLFDARAAYLAAREETR